MLSAFDRVVGNAEAWMFHRTGDFMKGWRTMAIGLGFTALGVALLVFADQERADMAAGLVMAGLSMAGMRAVTSTPVGGKE